MTYSFSLFPLSLFLSLMCVLFVHLGDEKAHNHIPMACKDSVAIMYMFDLTSRCTLNRYKFYSAPWPPFLFISLYSKLSSFLPEP